MSEKSSAEVIIGGKVYTLSGYEGEEYLQKVAAYINNKINEFDSMEDYRRFPTVQRSTEKKRTQKKKNRYGDDFIVPFSL